MILDGDFKKWNPKSATPLNSSKLGVGENFTFTYCSQYFADLNDVRGCVDGHSTAFQLVDTRPQDEWEKAQITRAKHLEPKDLIENSELFKPDKVNRNLAKAGLDRKRSVLLFGGNAHHVKAILDHTGHFESV